MVSLDIRRREYLKALEEFQDRESKYHKALEEAGMRYVRDHLIITNEGSDIVFLCPDGVTPRVSKLAAPTLAKFFTAYKGEDA